MNYAEKIKEMRKQKGLSQEQLAEELDVSRQSSDGSFVCRTDIKWYYKICYLN